MKGISEVRNWLWWKRPIILWQYYFQQTYLEPGDYGWLGRRADIEKKASRVRNETKSFNEITQGRKEYAVSLYMFVNLLDKIGPKDGVRALHRDFRQYRQENGKCLNASDSMIESFSKASKYNLVPYFDSYHVRPTGHLKSRIYQSDYEIPFYLRELVDSEDTAVQIRERLNLKGVYDLVTAADLKDTGYTGHVTVHLEIDDIGQVKGRRLTVKDGSRVVKTAEIQGETVSLGELPIGVYGLLSGMSS